MFNFKQTSFVLTDPELIKKILIKDFDHFVNHNGASTSVDRIFDRALFALHDKEWRDMRTTLSPIFTSSKMKMMYGLLCDHANDFVSFFRERVQKGETLDLDVLDIFARFTADGISTAVLGFEADCVRNKESYVYKMAKKLLHDFFGPIGNVKFTLAFVMPEFYKFLGLQCISQEIRDFFQRVVVDVMHEREIKNISRPDVIQLLLQAKKGQLQQSVKETETKEKEENFSANVEYHVGGGAKNASHFSDDDWIAQGFIFFGAG
jgi:cytochrome P450 family 9